MPDNKSDLKLFYSIKEVAQMFGVNESTLRFWETAFPQLKPFRAGRGVRKYTQEDIEQIKLIHHLVKEQGLTIDGARHKLSVNKEGTDQRVEILERLRAVRDELQAMSSALDSFTYDQIDKISNPSADVVGQPKEDV